MESQSIDLPRIKKSYTIQILSTNKIAYEAGLCCVLVLTGYNTADKYSTVQFPGREDPPFARYRIAKRLSEWVLLSAAMVELDGDDIRISSRGKLAERDIVQVRYAAY